MILHATHKSKGEIGYNKAKRKAIRRSARREGFGGMVYAIHCWHNDGCSKFSEPYVCDCLWRFDTVFVPIEFVTSDIPMSFTNHMRDGVVPTLERDTQLAVGYAKWQSEQQTVAVLGLDGEWTNQSSSMRFEEKP